jgi:hypothetical protein
LTKPGGRENLYPSEAIVTEWETNGGSEFVYSLTALPYIQLTRRLFGLSDLRLGYLTRLSQTLLKKLKNEPQRRKGR